MSSLFRNQNEEIRKFLKGLEEFLETKSLEEGVLQNNIRNMQKAVREISDRIPATDIDTSGFDASEKGDKLAVYQHLVYGYLYLVQHTLELILVRENGSSVAPEEMDALVKFYTTLDNYRRSVVENKGKDEGMGDATTMLLLLKYIGFFKNKLDKDMREFLDKFTPENGMTPEDVASLQELLKRLTDKPTDQEMSDYTSFYEKLNNIADIAANLSKAKERISEEKLEGNEYIKNRDILSAMLEKITRSGRADFDRAGTNREVLLSVIDSLASTTEIKTEKLQQKSDDPKKEEVLEKKELASQVDDFYYALVDLYETVSGAVRVYIRTKDIVNSVPVESNEDPVTLKDTSNGITKDRNTNKLSIKMTGVSKPYEFGPFYSIVPTGTTNKGLIEGDYINMKNFLAMFDKAKKSQKLLNLVFFTYGFSGSGKSYSLFNKDDTRPENQGILYTMKDKFETNGYKLEFSNFCKIYGYLEDNKFKPDISSRLTKATDLEKSKYGTEKDGTVQFVQEQVDVSILKSYDESKKSEFVNSLSVDSFIKSTPNNPQSSRGFLILWFDVTHEGTPVGKVGFVDMAGNEDPYDLMVKLSPTLYWPSTENERNCFMMETPPDGLNYGKVDLVCHLLQKQIFKYICSSVNFLSKIYRIKGVASKEGLNSSLKTMLSDLNVIYMAAGSQFSLKFESKKNKELTDDLNAANSSSIAQVITTIINFAVSQNFDAIKNDKAVKDIVKSLYLGKKNGKEKWGESFFYVENIKEKTIETENQKGEKVITIDKNYIEMNVRIKQFTSKSTRRLVRYAIQKQMEQNEDDLSKNVVEIDATRRASPKPGGFLSDFIKNELVKLVNALNAQEVNEGEVTKICETLLYTLINEDKDSQNKERTSQIKSVLEYASLAKYMMTLSEETENADYPIGLKIPVFINFNQMSVTEGMIQTYLEMTLLKESKLSEKGPMSSNIFTSFKENTDIIMDTSDKYLKIYFSNTTRDIMIENKPYPFPQDYLLRIIQEGFFINQANAELVEFLLQKKDGEPVAGEVSCELNKPDFYFEKYNKFHDLSKVPGKKCKTYTGLVEFLKETFEEGATAKYIMLCNVRREEDIKFRLGAIATLQLVENLKST